jgi:hypothetical protein
MGLKIDPALQAVLEQLQEIKEKTSTGKDELRI